MKYLLIVVLGGCLLAAGFQSLKEVRSAEAERDFWRELYLIQRRGSKVINCHDIDAQYVMCERKPQ